MVATTSKQLTTWLEDTWKIREVWSPNGSLGEKGKRPVEASGPPPSMNFTPLGENLGPKSISFPIKLLHFKHLTRPFTSFSTYHTSRVLHQSLTHFQPSPNLHCWAWAQVQSYKKILFFFGTSKPPSTLMKARPLLCSSTCSHPKPAFSPLKNWWTDQPIDLNSNLGLSFNPSGK